MYVKLDSMASVTRYNERNDIVGRSRRNFVHHVM